MKILIASSIDTETIDHLKKTHEVVCAFNASENELMSHIKGCDTIIFRSGVSLNSTVLAAAPKLQLLIRAGSGLDNLDLEYIAKHRLTLFRIPEPACCAVAEMALGLMLALARNLKQADSLLCRGRWAKHELTGHLLNGKVLGIVGLGQIGTRTAQLGAAVNMRPIGCVANASRQRAHEFYEKGIQLADFEEVISWADFLCLHVPLNITTHDMINSTVLSRLKPGAFLINLARGGVVNEDALYDALTKRNGLGGAGLDVHNQEGEGKISRLANLPNVILTPHIGSMTIDTQKQIGARIVEYIEAFETGTSRILRVS